MDEKVDGNAPERMPYIVIVIDELADIMQAYPKELESAIVRLAQMSRAVGIHLIISTQRPSVNVITGLIKANIPSRVALQVISQIDSRTILDCSGAEKLLGAGDMLFLSSDMSRPDLVFNRRMFQRVSLRKAGDDIIDEADDEGIPPEFIDLDNLPGKNAAFGGEQQIGGDGDGEMADDPLYEKAKEEVIKSGKASTSFLQRRIGVGYSRGAKLIDRMEQEGIIGPANGSKARDIL